MTQFTKHLIWLAGAAGGMCFRAQGARHPLLAAVPSTAARPSVKQAAYADIDAAINQPESVLADQDAEPFRRIPLSEPASGGLDHRWP